MEARLLAGLIVAIFVIFSTLIGFLSKWIVSEIKRHIDSIEEHVEGVHKEVLLNKCDIIAIDDTLDNVQGEEYTHRKRKKKTEIIEQYQAQGKLG